MLYARKLTEDAWFDDNGDKNAQHIDSDSATDLKTDSHELSVWRVPDDQSNLDQIALAIALTQSEPKGFFVALINPEDVSEKYSWSIPIEDQDGTSYYSLLNSEHKNFMVCTIDEIGYLVSQIHDQYISNDKFVRYSRTKIIDIFVKAIDGGLLKLDGLRHENKKKWELAYNEQKAIQK